jgi:hypothetical protein
LETDYSSDGIKTKELAGIRAVIGTRIWADGSTQEHRTWAIKGAIKSNVGTVDYLLESRAGAAATFVLATKLLGQFRSVSIER